MGEATCTALHYRLVVLAVIAVAITGVRIYQARVDEEMQYRLAEGIKAFQEYASGGKEDSLKKAESISKDFLHPVATESRRSPCYTWERSITSREERGCQGSVPEGQGPSRE